MKYIIVHVPKPIEREVSFVFENHIVHADMLKVVQQLPGFDEATIASAGDCTVDALCAGSSETLKVTSRSHDSRLICMADYGVGIL